MSFADEEACLPWTLRWTMRHWWAYEFHTHLSAAEQAKKRYWLMLDLGRGYACSPHIPEDWGAEAYRELLFLKVACATPRMQQSPGLPR